MQLLFLVALVFGLSVAEPPYALGGYAIMQMSELHALIVFRRISKAARMDPTDDLSTNWSEWRIYELGSALAATLALGLAFLATPPEHRFGVMALWSLAAVYMVNPARHDFKALYGAIAIVGVGMMSATIVTACTGDGMMLTVAYLALTVFGIGLALVTAASVRENLSQIETYQRRLIEAFGKLEEQSRAKSNLLAQLSHEFRTPMNGILGAVELIANGKDQSRMDQMVTVARDSGARMVNLLDRILELSALDADNVKLRLLPTRLGRLIEDRIALIVDTPDEAGRLEFVCDEALDAPRKVDAERVKRCLDALIHNALTHGAGRVVVAAASPDTADLVRITVSDEGEGVDQDSLSSLFTPFANKVLDAPRATSGAGLSLPICRAAARAMGGDLTYAPGKDGGAEFTFTFEAPLFELDRLGRAGGDTPLATADQTAPDASANQA
ncbi:MAG: HAMP domain-containing sensor histidine kinase [Pseudomonadota bacterium]